MNRDDADGRSRDPLGHGLALAREGRWAALAAHLDRLAPGDRLRLALRVADQLGRDAAELLAAEADRQSRPADTAGPGTTRTVEYYRCWDWGRGTGGQW